MVPHPFMSAVSPSPARRVNRTAKRLFSIVLALGTMFALPAPAAEPVEGRIVEVGAGDTATLELAGGIRRSLRLHAVAAPTGRQPWAAESRRALAALVQGRTVRFEALREDAYRRLIGKLLVAPPDCAAPCAPTRDAGLAQLEAGLAWWYREERKQQTLHDQGYYEYADFDARQQRRGLWQDTAPVAPWEWRKRQGGNMARATGSALPATLGRAQPAEGAHAEQCAADSSLPRLSIPGPRVAQMTKPAAAGAATGFSL